MREKTERNRGSAETRFRYLALETGAFERLAADGIERAPHLFFHRDKFSP